jgi:hypothetical protein
MRSEEKAPKKTPNGTSPFDYRSGQAAQCSISKPDRNWIRLRQDFGVTSCCIHPASPVKDSSQLLNNLNLSTSLIWPIPTFR